MRSFVGCRRWIHVFLLMALCDSSIARSDEADGYLVQTAGRACVHGLHPQPKGGPFSVYLFCDDAGGSNIGVVLSAPGAGPGKIVLDEMGTWDKWNETDRFWQIHEWATDVTSFAWSPDPRYLYVATAEVYGTGHLYKLDLRERLSEKLLPDLEGLPIVAGRDGFATRISHLDPVSGLLTVEIEYWGHADGRTILKEVTIK